MSYYFNKLALFDVDKTLVRVSKGHSTAFSVAFKIVYGIDAKIDEINHHGMTDQQVIIEVLKNHGVEEQTIKLNLRKCMKVIIDSYNKMIESDEVIALDGVRESLNALSKSNILLGLVTGNLEPVAINKLKKANLDHYFKVGGFGTDDIDRANLVNLAIKRAIKNFDFKFNNNVYLFGDTPQDMQAGKKAGIKTIGIATGIYSKEQLESAGADFVLENLKDKNAVLEIVLYTKSSWRTPS